MEKLDTLYAHKADINKPTTGLPMEDLIGGPLNAAAKANAAMALTQTIFLMETCFGKINSKLDIQTVTTKFNLPLIIIIPINSLGVNNVDITFEMEVKYSYSEPENETKGKKGSFETKLGWDPLFVSIKGSASYSSRDSSTHDTHYEKSNSAKYTVNVHAGQLPVPKGVNTIIETFTQAIQPINFPLRETRIPNLISNSNV